MKRSIAFVLLAAMSVIAFADGKKIEPPLPGWIGMGYAWSKTAKNRTVLIVQRVTPDGPAAAAGMKAGDIVSSINDRRVDFGDELDLLLFLGDHKPGQHLVFGVTREGKARKIDVTLGTMPESSRAAWNRNLEVARQQRVRNAAKP